MLVPRDAENVVVAHRNLSNTTKILSREAQVRNSDMSVPVRLQQASCKEDVKPGLEINGAAGANRRYPIRPYESLGFPTNPLPRRTSFACIGSMRRASELMLYCARTVLPFCRYCAFRMAGVFSHFP